MKRGRATVVIAHTLLADGVLQREELPGIVVSDTCFTCVLADAWPMGLCIGHLLNVGCWVRCWAPEKKSLRHFRCYPKSSPRKGTTQTIGWRQTQDDARVCRFIYTSREQPGDCKSGSAAPIVASAVSSDYWASAGHTLVMLYDAHSSGASLLSAWNAENTNSCILPGIFNDIE